MLAVGVVARFFPAVGEDFGGRRCRVAALGRQGEEGAFEGAGFGGFAAGVEFEAPRVGDDSGSKATEVDITEKISGFFPIGAADDADRVAVLGAQLGSEDVSEIVETG